MGERQQFYLWAINFGAKLIGSRSCRDEQNFRGLIVIADDGPHKDRMPWQMLEIFRSPRTTFPQFHL